MQELTTITPNYSYSPVTNEPESSRRWCCDRERVVTLAKDCVPVFKSSAYLSLGCVGASNAITGLLAIFQGVADDNTEYVQIGAIALVIGAVQIVAAKKLMEQFEEIPSIISLESISAFSGFVVGTWAAGKVEDLSALEHLPKAARIAIGLTLQMPFSMLSGGKIAVVALLVWKGIDSAKRACYRRNNPAGDNLLAV